MIALQFVQAHPQTVFSASIGSHGIAGINRLYPPSHGGFGPIFGTYPG